MTYRHSHYSSIVVLATCLFVLSLVPAGRAAKKNPGKSIRININKISLGISLHQKKIRQAEKKEHSVLNELARIDQNLQEQQKKIENLQKRLLAQVRLLAQREGQLTEAIMARDNVLQHLQKRLRSFYLMGKTGLLNVVFSQQSLPELMLFSDAYKRLILYDKSVIDRYRASVTQLQQARLAQELEKGVLQQFISQTENDQKELARLKGEKEHLLTRIKTKKSLYKQALQEMEKAEDDLTKTLAAIKHKEALKKQGFRLSKGKLAPPVKGKLIRRFGEVETDMLKHGRKAKGITIATTGEAAVRSVYKGKVTFAGYKRGYGNMIIIDHGYKYFTVYSRLDTIVVHKGEKVKKGSLLGSTGGMSTLFSKGLYFEIRHGSKPMNPLRWLRKKSY